MSKIIDGRITDITTNAGPMGIHTTLTLEGLCHLQLGDRVEVVSPGLSRRLTRWETFRWHLGDLFLRVGARLQR